MILCDTNIFIEVYKSNPDIISNLKSIGSDNLAVSIITKTELYFGARNKKELAAIKAQLQHCECFSLGAKECSIFIRLMESYSLSHKPSIPDMLIAATALTHDLELYTLNIKDFSFIPDLTIRPIAIT